MTLHHIGVLSEDLDKAKVQYAEFLGIDEWSKQIHDPLQDVHVLFGRVAGGLTFEFVMPASDESPAKGGLKSRKNILNHLCYRVESLADSGAKLCAGGAFQVTETKPAVAFGNEAMAFFCLPTGWLVELVEGTFCPFDL